LGGENWLRAYSRERYTGACSRYFAAELRWNFSQTVKPFNFWIWKDIATGIQLALFHEWGTVAEHRSELGDIWRASYGLGFRLISASGYVYRADIAKGREGEAVTVVFEYPWQAGFFLEKIHRLFHPVFLPKAKSGNKKYDAQQCFYKTALHHLSHHKAIPQRVTSLYIPPFFLLF